MLATALVGAVIVLLPHARARCSAARRRCRAEARVELPARLAEGWSAEGARLVEWAPMFGNPSAKADQAYAGPAGTVGVASGLLPRPERRPQARQLAATCSSACATANGAFRSSAPRETLRWGRRRSACAPPRSSGASSPDAAHRPHLVVWRFYWIDGRFIAGDVAAKIAGVLARLQGHGDEGAAIVLYADGETRGGIERRARGVRPGQPGQPERAAAANARRALTRAQAAPLSESA